MHLLLTLLVASSGTVRARTSSLVAAPLRLPHVGQAVSLMGVLKVDAWIRNRDAEGPVPFRAKMNCSGWKMLGPKMETWWSIIILLK